MSVSQLRMFPVASKRGLIIDLFAGGGGASTGIAAALGQQVDVAVNHDETAIAVHTKNHPHTVHYRESVWSVRPRDVTGGRKVWMIWGSPDCRHHSNAKGGKPVSKSIRSLPNVLVKWAKETRADVIFCENVIELLSWGPIDKRTGRPVEARKGESFRRWVRGFENLGYVVEWRVLDASLYGAPTKRRRLFVIARRDGKPIVWPEPTHGPGRLAVHTAAECIDWTNLGKSIFDRDKPLCEKTMWRIAQGLRRFVLESDSPFVVRRNDGALVVPTLQQSGYGERPGQAARVPGVNVPLGTIVAGGQKHALITAWLAKHYGDPTGPNPVLGSDLRDPLGTVTARDHHSSVTALLDKAPANDDRVRQVRSFLTVYYGGDKAGQSLDVPMRTITSKHRLGVVTVEGIDYQIVDIRFRMLEPEELLRAQFGQFARGYDLSAAKSKASKVRLIGNSVPPEMVQALIAANVDTEERMAA